MSDTSKHSESFKLPATGTNLEETAIGLLKELIATPSFSKEEDNTADIIEKFFSTHGITTNVYLNNIWAKNQFFDEQKPTILLNSHHDTVKPNKGYTLDPFSPIIKNYLILNFSYSIELNSKCHIHKMSQNVLADS